MKYIYTWNEDILMYSIRVATEYEEERIKNAVKMLKHCKTVHDSILHDADVYYHGDIDRFIDDEAWYTVQELHHDLAHIDILTNGLINLDTGKYYFPLW